MNEVSNKRAVIVGLFILIGLSFLVGGIMMVGNLKNTFKKNIKIVSLFEDVSGLQTGNNIWFSGVKVGTVSKLNIYGRSRVAVTLNIEIGVQQYIRKDAKVKIGTDGLIGNKIIVIYGGSSDSEEVEEGDTLIVEKTFSTEDMMNMLQENNKNLLAITTDFKTISNKIVKGEGSVGKLLNDNAVYDNINAATLSLQNASLRANQLMGSLQSFTSMLNTKGSLVNNLVTDTVVFNSVKASVLQLEQMADTASVFVTDLKEAAKNPNSTIGVLIRDEEAGKRIQEIILNLEISSEKLKEDLEALQHNFLFRAFFKKKAKNAK